MPPPLSWNDQRGYPDQSPRQLPIAFLIYLQQRGDPLLTAILMGNSSVTARGERQAFSRRKGKAAHHHTKCCRSPSLWRPQCSAGLPQHLNALHSEPGVWVILFCSSWGYWARGEEVTVFSACFPGLPVWWESSDRSIWWALGCPAACDHRWSAGGLWHSLSSSPKWHRVGPNRTTQSRMAPTKLKTQPGDKKNARITVLNFVPSVGTWGLAISPQALNFR